MERRKITTLGLAVLTVMAVAVLLWAAGSAGASPPLGPAAQSGAPLLLNYQGRLTDPDTGEPVPDGTYDITFNIFPGAISGGILWSETQAVEVRGGLFNVLLGTITPLSAADFDGTARWLELEVEGETLSPRIRMVSVPYAIQAEWAENAASASWAGLTGMPAGFADGVDDDTLGGLSPCGNGQVAKWDNGAGQWQCANDDTAAGGGDFWSLTGNAGTTPVTNFLGTTDGVSLTLAVSGTVAMRLEPTGGTPNVIGGSDSNTVASSVVGATIGGGGASGSANGVGASYATVGGGRQNTASGDYTTVGGGLSNTASGFLATVGGGGSNIASQMYATVGGGSSNNASNQYATVGGGQQNTASNQYATVGGGDRNTASNMWATVGGGQQNAASHQFATVGGGHQNISSGIRATVGGGDSNTASGAAVTVGGGYYNTANGVAATVGGGDQNTANGDYATVGGGHYNIASGDYATVSGGYYNTASADYATVPGGYYAQASLYGQMAYASGPLFNVGDAQASLYVLSNTSSYATETPLYLDGRSQSQRLTLASDRTLTFDILVVARSHWGNSAGYRIEGVIANDGGATRLIGTPTVTTLGEDIAAWKVAVVADDTNDALVINVTGADDPDIGWVATVRTAEVIY